VPSPHEVRRPTHSTGWSAIREKIEELKQQKTFADQVKRRTDLLLAEVQYRNETDSVPTVEGLQLIPRTPGGQVDELEMARRTTDALRLNVVADDYYCWP
jgi:hypothetical protein